jgi:ABC-type uncharacterized transport system permease subunit
MLVHVAGLAFCLLSFLVGAALLLWALTRPLRQQRAGRAAGRSPALRRLVALLAAAVGCGLAALTVGAFVEVALRLLAP